MFAGAVVGGAIGQFVGALAGVALGYSIASHLTLRARLESAERALAELNSQNIERKRDVHAVAPPPAAPRAAQPPPQQPSTAAREAPVFEKESRASSPLPTPQAYPPTPTPTSALAPIPRKLRNRPREELRESEFPTVIGWIRDWFFGGNLVVRVGILVLFIGVGFLLKFAVDRDMVPIEVRLSAAALGGIALLAIGWRLRVRLRSYGLALQGGGVGLLYLTAFAALRFYQLLPPAATFAILVAVAILSAVLAVRQDALVLAALGALGGYLAPILTSTGQGDHVVLFSYYALLDAGIVGIAWFKAWRPLNLQAFVFTYGIGTAWGVLRYSPEQFATTEPFVALFFVMFLAVAVLFALRTAPRLTDYVDGTLVFGVPAATILLQSELLRGRPYALSASALVLSAVYLLLARTIWNRRSDLRMLAESFLALGIAFATLAIPLALDGHWTAGAWALEGAALFWIGVRQDRGLAMASGILLQLGAFVSYALGDDVAPALMPVANSEFVGALLISAGGLVTARVVHRFRDRLPGSVAWLASLPFYWALAWWSFAGVDEIMDFLPREHWLGAQIAFATGTAFLGAALSRWDDWRIARVPTVLLLPVLILLAGVGLFNDEHLLVGSAALAWPLALASWFWLLHWRYRHDPSAVETPLHLATLWFVVGIVAIELTWQVRALDVADPIWQRVVADVVCAFALLVVLLPSVRARWPVSEHPRAYLVIGAGGLAFVLWLRVLVLCLDDASAQPFAYLPVLNPAELAQIFSLTALAMWLRRLWKMELEEWSDLRLLLLGGFVIAVFALLNAMLLRAIHHFAGVDYTADALLASTLVQASLSLFWGILALGSMVAGTSRANRVVWFIGAGLLGVVLAKMFLVDLSRTGTVARIVSFIGVGVLMLIIGRYSPVPPSKPATEPVR
jgi:uncharacterized membrane protein